MLYRSKADEEIRYIEEKLEFLTLGIPDMTTDEVPRRYQRHTAGVSGRFSRVVHRVAQAIT